MTIAPEELRTLGNTALLQLPKTAFFCSRVYPTCAERGTYLWALEQRYRGHCIISGFHSQLEQSVFRYLLQGAAQPIVYVLGRGIQPKLRFEYGPEIDAGRLLFVSPFESDTTTVTPETADIRNQLIAQLADKFFVPYVTPGGTLEHLLLSPSAQNKPVYTLNIPENRDRLRSGAFLALQPNGVFGRDTDKPNY
ncbi:DNA-binding protein [Hymenobacter jejuensis]|uniref:DNA-binding protein n=1 Tax=Hymenobacter jejuensis TaxID=2502781 RepID=A0A5B8A050_9BACT|nr:DNA-binding protein [Hymenobacter jejuensis]QDA60439.1 DNA-binding protein [Hymenobacter jejuensis]